eukprot:6030244-Ditylum_brightwellii.AAC.1
MGENCIALYNIPMGEELVNASKENRLCWDCLATFSQTEEQSNESYEEQGIAIKTCKDAIDSYANAFSQDTETMCIGMRGSPGSGLNVIATVLLATRANYLGGKYWYHIFCLPTEDNLSAYQSTELAIVKLLKNPKKLNFLMILDVILVDEIGKKLSQFIQAIDIILRRIRDNNVFLDGVMLIGTLDHTQIKSIKGIHFWLQCM